MSFLRIGVHRLLPSTKVLRQTRKMHIKTIPMWTGSHDNYAYILSDEKTKDAVIIDPANPPEVLPVLKKDAESGSIKLQAILNTHHHYDHAGGNSDILKAFSVPVLGGEQCQNVSKVLKDREVFQVGNIKVTPLHTPCHTKDSICYYAEDTASNERAVFTGDTLFIAGCGRFFEGNAEMMHKALNETLAALPDDTKVYPGHEYTKSNIKFGRTVLDSVDCQKLVKFCEENEQTQGKFTIGDEKKHNVFMKVDSPEIQQATGETDPVAVISKLRKMKNEFK